jgi:hypothetical protein
MILAYRMVRLIEKHSHELVLSLQEKLEQSDRCPSYRNVPRAELGKAVGELYQHLGEWLLGKTEADIRRLFEEIGARRAEQGVPLCELLWCLALVKENLLEYLRRGGEEEQVAELFGELEVLQLLEQFFDHALYFAALGYEQALRPVLAHAAAAGK